MHFRSGFRTVCPWGSLLFWGLFLVSHFREAIGRPSQTVVTNNSDFALRDAIAQGGRIVFSFDGTIAITNVFQVDRDVVLDAGTNTITLDGGGKFQMFRIAPGVTLAIQKLTLINGRTKAEVGVPGLGGAIFNEGTFAATECVFSNNRSIGGPAGVGGPPSAPGFGGAIYSTGDLLLTNILFLGNHAIGGKDSMGNFGAAAFGGALYIKSGTGFITNSLFATNLAQSADSKFTGNGAGGGGYVENGTLTIAHCQFAGNSAVGASSVGSAAGLGGALYLSLGEVEISQSQFQTNLSQGGMGGGGVQSTQGGGVGSGGAIYIDSARTRIRQTSILRNVAEAGNTYNGLSGHGHATPGFGGGISNDKGELTIANSTIAQNQARGGTQIQSNPEVADAHGAGIYNSQGHINFSFCTIAGNEDKVYDPGANIGNPEGDGIYNLGEVTLDNSILDQHLHGNISGTVTDGGHNISSDSSGHFISSLENTDPKLGPVTDNGGPTLTMALLDGSPAVDTGSTTGPGIDQRGYARPFGAGFDIGAVEQSPSQTIDLQIEAVGGKIRISFTARHNFQYDLKESTDLSIWNYLESKTSDPMDESVSCSILPEAVTFLS